MAKRNEIKLNLPSADDLFSTQEQRANEQLEKVVLLPPDNIKDFPNHPFKVRQDEEMEKLAESIEEYGILVPCIVRHNQKGELEMVAGHRRKFASEIAGVDKIPCLIRQLTDEESTIIMVDSNLQREKVLPSEKAFAYKMKIEAIKRQGNRTDLTSSPLAKKSGKKYQQKLLVKKIQTEKILFIGISA